ncbi:MAG TPA: hypothetical protein VGR96_05635 [Acidobacteriaceae bacterium]|nr:hypothetical protein [Acidobacteriaceae bacterium]
MRFFEIAITGLLVAAAVWRLAAGAASRPVLAVFLGLNLAALVMHAAFEGVHWQMAPAYLGVLLLAGLFFFERPLGQIPAAGAWAMIALALSSSFLSAILPMFRLPQPTGPFPLGTRLVYLVDQSREEDAAPGKGRKRELMVQIWYPAGPSRNGYAPYRRRQETTLLSSYQSVLATHARQNAPVAQDGAPFPVLLFNPSWNGRRTQNTYLVEDLASHGFIVVAIDHTYNSGPIAFPDGRVVQFVPVPEMQNFSNTTIERVNAIAQKEVEKQARDDIFVLDQLEAMGQDPKSPFYGHLDTSRAGALGHSIGGAVAAEACSYDPRIRAALDLDGSLFATVQKQGLDKPFMFIEEDFQGYTPEEMARLSPADRINAEMNESDTAAFEKYGGYRIYLQGSTHVSFTDKVLFSPLKALSGRGTIRPRREVFIVRAYALAFFDQVLKEEKSQLLSGEKSSFPEARLVAEGSFTR